MKTCPFSHRACCWREVLSLRKEIGDSSVESVLAAAARFSYRTPIIINVRVDNDICNDLWPTPTQVSRQPRVVRCREDHCNDSSLCKYSPIIQMLMCYHNGRYPVNTTSSAITDQMTSSFYIGCVPYLYLCNVCTAQKDGCNPTTHI